MRRRTRIGLAAIAVGALALSACANTTEGSPTAGSDTDDDSGPYRVGVLVPTTGALSAVGEAMRDGIMVQADIINEQGGVNGREIELIFKDDQSTPEIGVTAMNEFVRDDVDAVLGGYASAVTLAVQPIAARANMLYFVAGSQTSQMFGDADPNALRINTNSEVAGYSAARYIADSGAETVGILWENSAYGQDALAQFESELESIGGVEIVESAQFETGDTDFRTAVGNVKAADPDVAITFASQALTGQVVLMQQLTAAELDSQLMAGFGTVFPETIELAGESAEGWISADIYYPSNEPFTSYEANVALSEGYSELRGGEAPNRWAAVTAQSLILWAQTVEEIDTTEAAAVADAIKGGSFENTILGDVTVTEQGQMTATVQIYRIEDGQPVPVQPIEIPEGVWQVGAAD